MPDATRAGDGVDRRGFFRIVGVGGAAAAAAGCGKTTEAILPFVIPPEHIVPGVATWFATVCRECPAKEPCLEFALTTNQDSGIWGGTSEEERRKLRRQWLAAKRRAS